MCQILNFDTHPLVRDVAGLQAVEPDAVGYLVVVVVCKYAHHNANFLGIVKNYPYFCNRLTEIG